MNVKQLVENWNVSNQRENPLLMHFGIQNLWVVLDNGRKIEADEVCAAGD